MRVILKNDIEMCPVAYFHALIGKSHKREHDIG